jgi:RNA polymerase sigma factor (sigma-70 family)
VILGPTRRARLKLFEEHAPWARSIARAVAKRLPPSFEVDDLEQVAGAELWKQTGLYNASRGVPFQGFALAAVRGACLMSVRRSEYKNATMLTCGDNDRIDETVEMEAGSWSDPHFCAEHREAVSRVLRVMACMRTAHRRVLEMHYLDGLPLTECAKRMGRREVYSLKEEAMEEMRKRLKTA